MSSDHGNRTQAGSDVQLVAHKRGGANGVERGHAEEALRAVDALAPIDFGEERKKRIDGVCEEKDEGVGTVLGARVSELRDHASIHREEIVSTHSRLARNARCDDHDVTSLEGVGEIGFTAKTHHAARSVDVRQVHRHAWRTRTVVQAQRADIAVHFHEQTERLPDTSRGTDHGHLRALGNYDMLLVVR